MNRSALLLAMPVLVLLGDVAARAETTDCIPILSLPRTITLPGVYCLTGDLDAGSANAILVDGPEGVVIDLNGHTLHGEAYGTGLVVRNARRVVMRNGSLVGFSRPIQTATTSYNTRIEDLTIMAAGDAIAIDSGGRGDVIQRNWIERGTTVIRSYGYGVRITDNDIVLATNGIEVNGADATVEDNRVSRPGLLAGTFGISTESGRAILSRNNVMAFPVCFQMGASTKYRENVTNGCTTTYTGGVSAGSNY